MGLSNNFLIAALLATSLSGASVSLVVKDFDERAVPGAKVTFLFRPLFDNNIHSVVVLTDKSGRAAAEGDARRGLGIRCEAAGHYPAYLHEIYIQEDVEVVPEMTVMLPKIIRPIPLYAANANRIDGSTSPVPRTDEWLGFDLLVGDWTAPDGKGREKDLLLKFSRKFAGYSLSESQLERATELSKSAAFHDGRTWTEEELQKRIGRWDCTLEVAFPSPMEGVVEEKERFLPYGRLKLPHFAPEFGYEPRLELSATTHAPWRPQEYGYFLRTRVKLDEKGEIVSANYSKIYGGFTLDPRGSVSFVYYFNPTPNDRNLEFHPGRNLFPKSMKNSKVRDP